MSVSTLPPLEHTGRVTQLRAARAEWVKIRSVRSTMWTLAVALLLVVGLPCLVAAITASHWDSMSLQDQMNTDPLDIVLAGVFVGQLPIAVLAVLTITAEYSTGMIRASFTAVPKRLPVLWAKLAVFSLVTLGLALPGVLIAYWATQQILHAQPQLQFSLGLSGDGRAVLCGAAYLVLIGIFALGIGAIVRNTAAGISLYAAIVFVVPPLLLLLPRSWRDPVEPYLPNNAASAIVTINNDSHMLNPGPGALVFVGYCALIVAVAAILMKRRDA